jgi:hypothetical protein
MISLGGEIKLDQLVWPLRLLTELSADVLAGRLAKLTIYFIQLNLYLVQLNLNLMVSPVGRT